MKNFRPVMGFDEQVRCFENVAAHLADEGVFVVEGLLPGHLYTLNNQQYFEVEGIETNQVRLDMARHDPVKQLLIETQVSLYGAGIQLNPIVTRYAWSSELDLMARITGLRLKERWGGWSWEPFTADGRNFMSVYGL